MARVEQSYTEHSKSIDKNGKYTSAEIPYLVFDAADEDEALAAVLASAPASCRELPLESIEIDERANETTYRVNAIYREEEVSAVPDSGDDDDESPTLSFDCGGGTKHLLYSLAQRNSEVLCHNMSKRIICQLKLRFYIETRAVCGMLYHMIQKRYRRGYSFSVVRLER